MKNICLIFIVCHSILRQAQINAKIRFIMKIFKTLAILSVFFSAFTSPSEAVRIGVSIADFCNYNHLVKMNSHYNQLCEVCSRCDCQKNKDIISKLYAIREISLKFNNQDGHFVECKINPANGFAILSGEHETDAFIPQDWKITSVDCALSIGEKVGVYKRLFFKPDELAELADITQYESVLLEISIMGKNYPTMHLPRLEITSIKKDEINH